MIFLERSLILFIVPLLLTVFSTRADGNTNAVLIGFAGNKTYTAACIAEPFIRREYLFSQVGLSGCSAIFPNSAAFPFSGESHSDDYGYDFYTFLKQFGVLFVEIEETYDKEIAQKELKRNCFFCRPKPITTKKLVKFARLKLSAWPLKFQFFDLHDKSCGSKLARLVEKYSENDVLLEAPLADLFIPESCSRDSKFCIGDQVSSQISIGGFHEANMGVFWGARNSDGSVLVMIPGFALQTLLPRKANYIDAITAGGCWTPAVLNEEHLQRSIIKKI